MVGTPRSKRRMGGFELAAAVSFTVAAPFADVAARPPKSHNRCDGFVRCCPNASDLAHLGQLPAGNERQLSIREGRAATGKKMAAVGHEDAFPRPRLSARCGVRKGDDRRNAPQWARCAVSGHGAQAPIAVYVRCKLAHLDCWRTDIERIGVNGTEQYSRLPNWCAPRGTTSCATVPRSASPLACTSAPMPSDNRTSTFGYSLA